MRNVEIKAKVKDVERLKKLSRKLCNDQQCTVLHQYDVFFKAPLGRLKLRVEKRNDDPKETAELISYNRPDAQGPKLSVFHKTLIEDHESLKETLGLAMGILGEVKKERHLFTFEQTRIHIDQVEGIGDFMELEVGLKDNQAVEEGQSIAESIMAELGVTADQLISGAYMDYILNPEKKF